MHMHADKLNIQYTQHFYFSKTSPASLSCHSNESNAIVCYGSVSLDRPPTRTPFRMHHRHLRRRSSFRPSKWRTLPLSLLPQLIRPKKVTRGSGLESPHSRDASLTNSTHWSDIIMYAMTSRNSVLCTAYYYLC